MEGKDDLKRIIRESVKPIDPMEDTKQRIFSTIRACKAVSLIISWEESRVKKLFSEYCKEKKCELFFWDVANGLRMIYPEAKRKINAEDTEEPNSCLDYIRNEIEYKDGASGVFVLFDFHKFWGGGQAAYGEDMSTAKIIRKVKNFCRDTDSPDVYGKTIFIVSPEQRLPSDLNKAVQIIDFPLPDDKVIKTTIGNYLAGVRRRIEIEKKAGYKCDYTDSEIDTIINGCLGLTVDEIVEAMTYQLVRYKQINPNDLIQIKQSIIRKSGLVEFVQLENDINSIGGLDILKSWLAKRTQAFSEQARDYGLPYPKGVLLVGIPGCGKSLCAKATATLYQMPLLRFDVGRVFGGIVGQSEANMREVQRVVEAVAPCVLWIDEIEKGMAGTRSSDRSDAGTASRVFQSFLTWMNEKKSPVFVVATANAVEALPPELLRKGRWDEIFFVDLPDDEERAVIFDIHIAKKNRDPQRYDIPALVAESKGYSGAEIEQAVIDAMFSAFAENREFETGDIVSALQATIPLSTTMGENIEALLAWAEQRARFASKGRDGKKKEEGEKKGIASRIEF